MGEGRTSFWADVGSFGREILIVVIGVALGLWAQQLASEAGWRDAVKSSKEDFKRELTDAADNAALTVALEPCARAFRELAERIVTDPASKARLPPWAGVIISTKEDAAWQAAASSQVLGHLAHKELEDYAYAYGLIRDLRDYNAPLRQSLAVIRTVDMQARTAEPGTRQRQLEAISLLRQTQTEGSASSQELVEMLHDRLKIDPSHRLAEDLAELRPKCLKPEAG